MRDLLISADASTPTLPMADPRSPGCHLRHRLAPVGVATAGARAENAWRLAAHRSYSAAVAKRRRRRCGRGADPDTVLARLRSPDPPARVRALHAVCPCSAGFLLYERSREEVKRLRKDPDPAVRAAALHVEHDACEIETIEAGLDRAGAQGWRYGDNDWVSKHRQRQATWHWLPR